MRYAFSAKGRGRFPGPILGRIERDKNIRKEGFHTRFARFADDGVGQLVAGSHQAVSKLAQTPAAFAKRNLRPFLLCRSRKHDGPPNHLRRSPFNMCQDLSRGGVDGGQHVDRDGRGSHTRDSNRFSASGRANRWKPAWRFTRRVALKDLRCARPVRARPRPSPTLAAERWGRPSSGPCFRRDGQCLLASTVPAPRPAACPPFSAPCNEEMIGRSPRSEEHTSELQSHVNLVCRLLLEKKKKK